jgi:two-component system sensor histidine kinase EvgS
LGGWFSRTVLVILGWCLGIGGALAAVAPVRVGLLAESQPFHVWPAGGRPSGFDVDLLERLSRDTGLRFDYVRYERWDALLADLAAGKVQVVTATARTADREIWMGFTRVYASAAQGFAGRRSETSVTTQPDLAGRRLALVRSFATEAIAAERFSLADKRLYDSNAQALDAVERGEADYVLGTAGGLRALLAERPGTALAVLRAFTFAQGQRRLATVRANLALRDRLDAAIGALEPAFLAGLVDRWLRPWELPPPRVATPPAPAAAGVAPLRVGYLPRDRPYTFLNAAGAPDGIAIELMQAAARHANLAIAHFEPHDLRTGIEALRAGRIDVMLGLTDTAERRRAIRFVGPYRNNPVILVSREANAIWSLEQLANRRLALVADYFAADYVRRHHPAVEIVSCVDVDACLRTVADGGADAALYGFQGTYARLAAFQSGRLAITGAVTELSDEHNLGLAPGRADLAVRLRDALDLAREQDLPAIERHWAARETQPEVDWARVRQGIAVGAAVWLLLLLAWWMHSRRLRREIAQTQAARAESEQYLAFMAHEVRNSLQSVAGAVALLRGSSRPDARQAPVLEALGRSSRSTLGLLNALLDRHRLHAGRLSLALRPESLERVLLAVVDEIRPAAQAKGLALRLERATELAGWWQIDALRVQQIVRNLLVNAVKFSRRGTITVRAGLADAARGASWRRVTIEVIDQGPGIEPAVLAQLFERFETAGGDRPGTGLGLHLSRDLARAIGGTLEASSPPAGGACFTLAFDAEAANEPPAPRRGELQRVLVVEDSPVYGLLLTQALANLGVATTLAESVAQAREALIASVAGAGDTTPAFDLVLSDTHLGDGRVDALLRFMRESVRPGVTMPPVICISADFEAADGERLIAAGASDLLVKDSDVAAFAARVLRSHADHHGAHAAWAPSAPQAFR